jgi:MFS transporter, OFA family, oxalate/formate antiporter
MSRTVRLLLIWACGPMSNRARMKRYVIVAASLVVQICLGGVYAWSVFVPALVADHGLSTTQTQAVFGTTIAMLALVMIYGGRLVERRGPRLPLLLSGLLFAGGYCLAALSDASFLGLLLGIGVLAGAAIGMGYVCPLTILVKWFPRHKGLITGVAVAGFGGGAVVLSALAQRLTASGFSVPSMFLLIGLTYGAAILLAGLLISVPPAEAAAVSSRPRLPHGRIVRQRLFWGLVLGMFGGTFAGLMVIGNLKPFGLDKGFGTSATTAAISALAIGNAAGRVTWGWLHDRLGHLVVPASLLVLGATMIALSRASSDVAFVAWTAAVGFCFGACFVLYAAEVASHWGANAVGVVYPLIGQGYGLSGILGPVTGGWLFDTTGTYAAAMLFAATLCTASAVGFVLLRRSTGVQVIAEASARR